MPGQVGKYMARISGPLMDRIDLQVEIMPVPFEELASMHTGETSDQIRERVIKARAIQTERFKDEPDIHCNAQMNSRLITKHVVLDSDSMSRLQENMTRFDMSARAYDRILKVARTIADLEHAATLSPHAAVTAPILSHHIAEAISYRSLDRSSWGAPTIPF